MADEQKMNSLLQSVHIIIKSDHINHINSPLKRYKLQRILFFINWLRSKITPWHVFGFVV